MLFHSPLLLVFILLSLSQLTFCNTGKKAYFCETFFLLAIRGCEMEESAPAKPAGVMFCSCSLSF